MYMTNRTTFIYISFVFAIWEYEFNTVLCSIWGVNLINIGAFYGDIVSNMIVSLEFLYSMRILFTVYSLSKYLYLYFIFIILTAIFISYHLNYIYSIRIYKKIEMQRDSPHLTLTLSLKCYQYFIVISLSD